MKALLICLLILGLSACQSEKAPEPSSKTVQTETKTASTAPPTEGKTAEQAEILPVPETEQSIPPTPPLFEDFQAQPKLSLFPRAGSFRPEDKDTEGLQFWRTYIDHLNRTSGPRKTDGTDPSNIAFGFRAIKGIDSVGVFSPIAVKPQTTYEVSTTISCDLEKGASAGIGILEFDEFAWIGQQYSESMIKKHQTGNQVGITLKGKTENIVHKFAFTTGPQTNMIHLIFFRDGAQDRNPVIIDDISVAEEAAASN